MEIALVVLCGFALDLIFGDPYWMPHPIKFIGLLIRLIEKTLHGIFPKTKKMEILSGVLLNISILIISFLLPYFILQYASILSIPLKLGIETFFCYQIFATNSLKKESTRVYKYLIKNDINNSRKYLSWIVGRDTDKLSSSQITKAVVETIAENTCDGVVAPLIFMIMGGMPLGLLYKAVNTLDSMVGYKNDKYINFGMFSAKVDDAFNFFPAILTAYIMIGASFILDYDSKNAVKIYKRDKYNHASPNSAKTESVCAGALDIQLAGDASYFGRLYKKKTIGDNKKPIEPFDIVKANRLMYCTAFLGTIFFVLLRVMVVQLI